MTEKTTLHDRVQCLIDQLERGDNLLLGAQQAAALLPLTAADAVLQARLLLSIVKSYIRQSQYAAALPLLHRLTRCWPDDGYYHYLLGFCLAQERQYYAALNAQRHSVSLAPNLPDSWYELGRLSLELGHESLAVDALHQAILLRPGWDVADHLLVCARVRHALLHSIPSAAECIRIAQIKSPRPAWLLREWCELAGSVLLGGEILHARLLLEALLASCPTVETASRALPRRLSLFLLLLINQLEPRSESSTGTLAGQLRESLWLPPCHIEQSLWTSVVQPSIGLVLSRIGDSFLSAEHGRLLLDSLPSLEPPDLDSEQLYRRVSLKIPATKRMRFAQLAESLRESSFDLHSLRNIDHVFTSVEEFRQSVGLDGSVRATIDAYLSAMSHRMIDDPNRMVALPGQETQALSLRERSVQALVEATSRFVNLDGQSSVALKPGHRRRWLLLASQDLPQCVTYRVEQKRLQLQRYQCQVKVLWFNQLDTWEFTHHLLWADALIVCRLPATYQVMRVIASARRFGVACYYDLDDLLFDPDFCPPALESYGGTLRPAQHRRFALDVPLFTAAMKEADALIFSTSTLAKRWIELHPGLQRPVLVLPNLATPELMLEAVTPRTKPNQSVRLAVASGTTAHKQAWNEELAPALAHLLRHNPLLELDLLGHLQLPCELLEFVERIRCYPFTSYKAYLQRLREAHIGLVVLEPGLFTDAKSAIRWMEFSLLGIAAVLSPTATYQELLHDRRHAYFARGTSQWIQSVQALINSPGTRCDLAATAYGHALKQFHPVQAESFWRPLIAGSTPTQSTAHQERRRLLVINVFFAPQCIGGATRVAQDQVRGVIQAAGELYDITVLCADHSPWHHAADASAADDESEPLVLDCHGWHGARVVRLSLRSRAWSQHADSQVESFCRRWFQDEGFHLIHAHCVQVLTASPLKVAGELGIPYIITLHDAWWLNPRLFLTSTSGKPIDPADPIGHFDQPDLQPTEVLERAHQRRRHLNEILCKAARRLAVSASFADVYRSAGVDDVDVLENDWRPMVVASRVPRPATLALRMCFVGGKSLHKGYAVLQAAVLRHSLCAYGAGAALTVIDSTLKHGDSYHVEWNGTPVSFQAPVHMDAMEGFYANHDLLIAPSIWPESFGLVTREALSAGLWVVASDIGALADPIEHGINGHRVPPGDPDALGMILVELCRNHPQPVGFSPSTTRPPAIPQLLSHYDQILG